MCRMLESIRGSYAGRMAPPGMPKMSVTPAASRDLTRLWAPVICPSCSLMSVLLAFIGTAFVGPCSVEWQQRTPRLPGQRGVDASADRSAGTPGAYKEDLSHGIQCRHPG